MKRKIYRLNNGVIEVYQFEPINYKLNLFRLEELKRIPKEEQILRRETTRSWFTPKKRVVYECENYILREFDFSNIHDMDKQMQLFKAYVNGVYRHDPVQIHDGLITLSPRNGMTDYRIQLTKDAYLGYLLENEQFDETILRDSLLDKQKGLFKISEEPISSTTVEELERLFSSELVPGSFDETMQSVERTSKVFQKIR